MGYEKPEDKARHNLINPKLIQAGWEIQDYKSANVNSSIGVAVEFFKIGKEEADYVLFVKGDAVGIIEAKKEGETLIGKETQSGGYLQDFISCYNPENRFKRKESERFKCFDYQEIVKRDKTNLDIFWLKDESLDDLDKLPEPGVIASELVEELEDALEQLKEIEVDLK